MSNSEIVLKFCTEEKQLNTDKDLYMKMFFDESFTVTKH